MTTPHPEAVQESVRDIIKRVLRTDLLKHRTAGVLLDILGRKQEKNQEVTDTSRRIPELCMPYRENYVHDRNLMRAFKPTLRTPPGVEITEAELKRTAEYMEKALGELALIHRLPDMLKNFHIRFSDRSHIAADRLILGVHDDYETIRATIFQLVEATNELNAIYETIEKRSGGPRQPKRIGLEPDDSDTLSCAHIRETLTQVELALDLLGTEKDLSKITILIQAHHFSPPHDSYIYTIPGQLYISQDIYTATAPNPDIRIAKALSENDNAKESTQFDQIKSDIKRVLFGCRILTTDTGSELHTAIRNSFRTIVMTDTRLIEDYQLLSKLNREHIEIRCSGTRSLHQSEPLIMRDTTDRMNRVVDIPFDIAEDAAGFAIRLFKDIQNRNFAA